MEDEELLRCRHVAIELAVKHLWDRNHENYWRILKWKILNLCVWISKTKIFKTWSSPETTKVQSVNPLKKSELIFWEFRPVKKGIKTNLQGKGLRFYTWPLFFNISFFFVLVSLMNNFYLRKVDTVTTLDKAIPFF